MLREQTGKRFSLELVYGRICNFLQKQGHDVELYFLSGNFLNDLKNIRKLNPDIIHITGDIHYFGIFFNKKKVILTIHDIGHYRNLRFIKKIVYRLIWFELPLLLYSYILFDSEITKKRVLSNFFFKPKNSKIVHLCRGIESKKKNFKRHDKDLRILQIGTLPHKNLTNLIEACSKLNDVKLYIVGKIHERDIHLLRKYNIVYKNFTNTTNDVIEDLYLNSDLLTFLSLHEGFGLPVIEAQFHGLPVICSNIEPLTEIAGSGAIFLDPNKPSELRSMILKIQSNKVSLKKISLDGLENSKRFDIGAVSDNHLHVYRQVFLKKNQE